VIKIPALIVLKVFAWGDQGTRTQKDLEDIDLILSRNEDNDPGRVYQELVEELADGVVDFINANIYLLGQDIAKHFQPNTILELNTILDKLIEDLADFNIDDANFPYLGDRLQILKQGIGSRPNI
jgi:predicted nucleotidyltransferase